MSEIRGRYLWYDCLTPDVPGAMAFYTAVMGWSTMEWATGGQPYQMFANGGVPFGGLFAMPPDAGHPPHWIAYIGTPDVRATIVRAESLGARIWKPPTEVPTVGTFAVIEDPQGAMFAAFTPANPPPEQPPDPGAGDISWRTLVTPYPDAAWDFYSDLFGWKKTGAYDMGSMGVYQMFGPVGVSLGGIFRQLPEMPGPAAWQYFITVDDLEAAVARVKTGGGVVMLEPHEVPGGDRIAMCADPQEAAFGLRQPKR
jgi:predicted enzyme related to lactoylglutathione lyase